MLDFDRVQAALEGLGANMDAAEAHGTLCALLLEDAGLPIWLGHSLDELPEADDVLAAERALHDAACQPVRDVLARIVLEVIGEDRQIGVSCTDSG